MNVAIIGHGFVGKALTNGLTNVKTYIVDPKTWNQDRRTKSF